MTTLCDYPGDRDDIIVSYLYDTIDPAERASFDAHLAACGVCRTELSELREVRTRLGRWTPPERAPLFGRQSDARTPSRAGWSALAAIPAWAQVAAAILIVGVAAGIANLRVQYGRDGLIVQTGWSRPAGAVLSTNGPAPWRADLAALERQLRTEFHEADIAMQGVASPRQSEPIAGADADAIRRVRALIDESERRQRREIALRVAEGVSGVVRDVQAQRQADLVRIERSLGYIQNNTGIEVAKQRDLLNYLVHASLKQ